MGHRMARGSPSAPWPDGRLCPGWVQAGAVSLERGTGSAADSTPTLVMEKGQSGTLTVLPSGGNVTFKNVVLTERPG